MHKNLEIIDAQKKAAKEKEEELKREILELREKKEKKEREAERASAQMSKEGN